MLEQREFKVQLTVITAHEYVVTARTEEEANTTAEGMLEDGEQGVVLSTVVDQADAYPFTEEETEEEDEE